jgi:hypothetical protein
MVVFGKKGSVKAVLTDCEWIVDDFISVGNQASCWLPGDLFARGRIRSIERHDPWTNPARRKSYSRSSRLRCSPVSNILKVPM